MPVNAVGCHSKFVIHEVMHCVANLKVLLRDFHAARGDGS